MPYLLDTNVLLRSAESGHPMQAVAVNAVATLLGRGEQLYITPQNLIEFWAVATRPGDVNGLGMTTAEALAELDQLEHQFPLLSDAPAVYQEWRHLLATYNVLGVRVHDTRLVAVMRAHQITHILTFNPGDFRRYAEVVVVQPHEVS